MAPTGYLSVQGVEASLDYLARTYASICTRIPLPETTHDGRSCSAIRIGAPAGSPKNGLLLLGGVHAREIVNPDLLVTFAFNLCRSYAGGTGLTFGGKSYAASDVKLIVDNVDLYVFPQVNPDGRAFVLSPTGDSWWRKNRRPTTASCIGVDLNRNFDFLWSSGIGTSADPCDYQIYKGTAAFSEAEARNVRYLLDTYPVAVMADVHSYSQLILYPWGDDDDQSTTPAMSFTNPAYDGVRGVIGDAAYREYIASADLQWFVDVGDKIKGAIAAVRGRSYTSEPGAGLYPTSGTSNDYAYGRHIAGGGARKVRAFCIETGTEFQPAYSEALNVIAEVSAGLVELCLSSVCVVESVVASSSLSARLDDLRRFRDRVLVATPAGERYARLLDAHNLELLALAARSRELREQALGALQPVAEIVLSSGEQRPKKFDAAVVARARKAMALFARKASPALRKSLEMLGRDLRKFEGKTVLEGLKAVAPMGPRAAAAKRPKRRKAVVRA